LGLFTFSISFTRQPSIVMEGGDKGVLNLSMKVARVMSLKSVLFQEAQTTPEL
jgi:hypothetical protein